MTSLNNNIKGKLWFTVGGIVCAVFSLFVFKGFCNFEELYPSAHIAVYVISLFVGFMGATVSYCIATKGSLPLKKDTAFYSVLAFVMTFVCILLAYVVMGLYPFGKETALVIDMYHQYAVFFVDLKEKLMAGESMIYSMRLGLGGSYLPLFAYYLASPFNIIAMFFPTSAMSEGVALVELLKIAAAALTFSFFLRKTFNKNDFSITLFSMMYALSSYVMAYSWNIMWLDCLIFMPLAALGMHQMIKEGKYLLYCVSLGLCLLANFYIGFMVCIALVLYFLSIVAAEEHISVKTFYGRLGRFALGSLLGGGLSAILIIPTYLALRLTSSANDVFPTLLQTNFSIMDLLSQQFFGIPVGIDFGDLPNIYCGILAVILIPVYVLNKKIPLRTKLCELGFVGVMFFSLMLNYTDWIWHGLHYPNGLPYRFAFVYIFALLIVSYRSLISIEKGSSRATAISVFGVLGLLSLLQALKYYDDSVKVVITGVLFIIIYGLILLLRSCGKMAHGVACAALALVMCFELTANSVYSVRNINDRFYYSDRDGFYNDYTAVSGAADELENMEESFFRMEHLPSNTCNENCLYNYNGLTVFSSCNAQRIVNLLDRLGYSNNGVNSHMYRCFNPGSDSLLGLKYLITESNLSNHPQLEKIGTVESDEETLYVYKNNYALSLGYLADSSLVSWDWDNPNPFEALNEFYELSTGISGVYEILDLEVESESNFVTEYYDGRYISGYPENYDGHGYVTASCVLQEAGQVFAYSEVSYMRALDIYYGGSGMAISNTEPYVADLGQMKEGERVAIALEVNSMTDGPVTCAVLNQERFAQATAILQQRAFIEELADDGHIKGTVTADDSGLLVFSIPYDEGWTVLVDGKETYVNALGEALLSVNLSPGTHTIELKFITPGLTAGIIVSVISLLIIVVLCLRKRLWPIVYKILPIKIKTVILNKSGFQINQTPQKEAVFDEEELLLLEELTNKKEDNIDGKIEAE